MSHIYMNNSKLIQWEKTTQRNGRSCKWSAISKENGAKTYFIQSAGSQRHIRIQLAERMAQGVQKGWVDKLSDIAFRTVCTTNLALAQGHWSRLSQCSGETWKIRLKQIWTSKRNSMFIEALAVIPVWNNRLLSVNVAKQVSLWGSSNDIDTKQWYRVYRALRTRTFKDSIGPEYTKISRGELQRAFQDRLTPRPMIRDTVRARSCAALKSHVNNL